MRKNDRGRVLGPRIAIGHVRGDLLMARIDELQRRTFEFGQHGNVGMPAKSEDVLHPTIDEVLHQLL